MIFFIINGFEIFSLQNKSLLDDWLCDLDQTKSLEKNVNRVPEIFMTISFSSTYKLT